MSTHSTSGESGPTGSPDFYLPDEILAAIPSDPYEQLDLARKITSMAIASRVTKLESELGKLRLKLEDKDLIIVDLEDKVSQLRQAYQEADLRLKITREDNMKLTEEKDSLALAINKQSRDLAKLETFKRQLMQSLNDDNSSAETVDIGTYDQSIPKVNSAKEGGKGYPSQIGFSGSTDNVSVTGEVSREVGRKFSMTPYISPRLTPTATPKAISANVSPGRYSAAGSPNKRSTATFPTKMQHLGQGTLSSWYPSSQQSSAANSPPHRRPLSARTRVDGKEFFRQARSRLSYEQFSAFLANIKELNAQKQSREETLRKADEIFGTENKDLYISFQGLLNRNIH